MFPQPWHLINAPDAMDVMRMGVLHFGHDTSYSFVSRTSNGGPSTTDGISAIVESEDVVHN